MNPMMLGEIIKVLVPKLPDQRRWSQGVSLPGSGQRQAETSKRGFRRETERLRVKGIRGWADKTDRCPLKSVCAIIDTWIAEGKTLARVPSFRNEYRVGH